MSGLWSARHVGSYPQTFACLVGTLFVATAMSPGGGRAGVAPATEAERGVALSITASGFRNTKGRAIIALYASSEAWLKSDKALRVETATIDGPSVTVRFIDLQPGVYAASAIHDENDNGKLDMRYFPVPRPSEGAGVSNNGRKRFGPPSWEDATFVLPDSAYAITINLRY